MWSSQRLIVIVACAATILAATSSHSQTADAPKRVPTAPAKPPTSAPPSDDLGWSEVGATAQCMDATYFHEKPSQGTCFDHGGVRKWLGDRLQH